jgi:hypothetical protein
MTATWPRSQAPTTPANAWWSARTHCWPQSGRYQKFESISLQRRVTKLSVPLTISARVRVSRPRAFERHRRPRLCAKIGLFQSSSSKHSCTKTHCWRVESCAQPQAAVLARHGHRRSPRPEHQRDLMGTCSLLLPPCSSRSGGLPGRRSSTQQTTGLHAQWRKSANRMVKGPSPERRATARLRRCRTFPPSPRNGEVRPQNRRSPREISAGYC